MTDEAYRTEYFGLDERTAQSARDVMDILVGNALAISALDLDTGELRLIKRGIELPQIEADKPMLFSTFNNLLIAQKLIHPEDGDGYLRGTALSALRTVFFGGEKQVYLRYRQKVDGEYRWVALAIVAGKRCEPGCAQVAMVLSGANGSGHANRPSEPREVDYDCDPLTGRLNRRRFERDLEWWGRNRPETLTCVYIDVVGLHEINNHLGHKAGDGMLCAVAGAMQRMFPLADTYRIGGDEFVVLWADHTGEQGAEAAARIKALLRESNYEISVGVTRSSRTRTSRTAWIGRKTPCAATRRPIIGRRATSTRCACSMKSSNGFWLKSAIWTCFCARLRRATWACTPWITTQGGCGASSSQTASGGS